MVDQSFFPIFHRSFEGFASDTHMMNIVAVQPSQNINHGDETKFDDQRAWGL